MLYKNIKYIGHDIPDDDYLDVAQEKKEKAYLSTAFKTGCQNISSNFKTVADLFTLSQKGPNCVFVSRTEKKTSEKQTFIRGLTT